MSTTTTPATGARARIAVYLSGRPLGYTFDLDDLRAQGIGGHNLSRRLRELREVGWDVPTDGSGLYTLRAIGAMPDEDGWKAGRKGMSKVLRRMVFERAGYRCAVCGVPSSRAELTVGHIVPVAAGGTDDLANLRAECSDCNEPWRDATYDAAARLDDLAEHLAEYTLPDDPGDLAAIIEWASIRLSTSDYEVGEK